MVSIWQPLSPVDVKDQLWNICHFKAIQKATLDIWLQHACVHWLKKIGRLPTLVKCRAGCRDRSSFLWSKKVIVLRHRTWVIDLNPSCKLLITKTHMEQNSIATRMGFGCWVDKENNNHPMQMGTFIIKNASDGIAYWQWQRPQDPGHTWEYCRSEVNKRKHSENCRKERDWEHGCSTHNDQIKWNDMKW